MKNILIDIKNTVIATIILGIICCGFYPVVVWGLGQLIFHHKANGSLIMGKDGNTVLGSELIGQPFSSDKYFTSRSSAAGTGYDASNSSASNYGPTSKKLIDGDIKQTAVEQTGTDKTVKIVAGPDVEDYDGIKLRLMGYCEQNGIPFELLRGGKPVDPKTFQDSKGNDDDVKLINAFNDDSNPLTIKAGVPIPSDAITASASGLDPHISPANARLQLARVAKARNVDPAKVQELVDKNTDQPFLGLIGDPGVNVLKLNLALDEQYPAPPASPAK